MHPFDDLSAVQSSLQHLMKREPPLVKILPRQSGTKEARYAHLFSGEVEVFEAKPEVEATATGIERTASASLVWNKKSQHFKRRSPT